MRIWVVFMTCGDVRNWLATGGRVSTPGGLLSAPSPEVEAHLTWCSQCREELAACLRFESKLQAGLVEWVAGLTPIASADPLPSNEPLPNPTLGEIHTAQQRLLLLLDARLAASTIVPVVDAPPSMSTALSELVEPLASTPLTNEHSALPKTRRWTRRVRVASVVAAGLLMVLLAAFWWPVTRVERLAIERSTLAGSAQLLASAVPYSGALPASFDSRLLRGAVAAYADVSGLRVDVLRFSFRRKSRVIEGRLLIIPVRRIVDVPGAASFPGGPLRYTDQFAASWWVEGDYAFACCLTTAEEAAFRALLPPRLTT